MYLSNILKSCVYIYICMHIYKHMIKYCPYKWLCGFYVALYRF